MCSLGCALTRQQAHRHPSLPLCRTQSQGEDVPARAVWKGVPAMPCGTTARIPATAWLRGNARPASDDVKASRVY
jgi:hypothetical protein